MYYQEIIEFDQSTADGALKKEDFGFFKLPASKDAKGDVKSIEGAPEGYMINSASKNIPLAVDFMKFITSPKTGRFCRHHLMGSQARLLADIRLKA